jgi:PAS domain S-box-containing protein
MPRPAGPVPDATDSAALLRQVFDHADVGLCVFDAQWFLRAWNQRLVELTGLDPELVRVGMPLPLLACALARAGAFGLLAGEAEVQAETARRVAELSTATRSASEGRHADGRILELRHNPLPGGGSVMICAEVTGRRAAQTRLADQQRILTLLVERTEQGIWFIDNALRTTDANPAMCRMLGLTLPQMLGRDIYQFVDEANAAIFRERVAQRSQGLAGGYEITLRHADGRPVHCYNNATPIFDAQGRKVGAIGMFSDITPLKRAEQQVRLSGELLAQKSHVLEMTLEALSQGVLSLDAEGRTHAYNRRFLELVQVPEALMRTRPTIVEIGRHQIAHGHFESVEQQPRLDSWRTDPPSYQRKRRDGVVLEIQTHRGADGSVVRTYADVTATVQAQQALRASESRFRAMADAAPALIWQSDAAGAPVWFNQRWLQYTGRTLAEELALGWAERMHADDLAATRAAFEGAAAGQHSFEVEYRAHRADGEWAWIADQGTPQFTSEGRCVGYIVYGWDITARKAAEAALRAAKEEAERANRAKSDFLSRMSHELRTPLNAVLGFGQLLLADTRDPLTRGQQGRVQELVHGGRHLLSLINDVLDLARIEAGGLHVALAPVDLDPLVEDCLRLVQPAADERRLTLTRPAPGEARLRVQADPTRLRQVLLNLLSNAIKYNRPGGRVELLWHPTEDGVRLEVLDTGPGLSAEQQARLFQPFERLDAAQSQVEGTGIGLALSKWLLSLMRGEIGVHSVPGEGCRFWLSLQRAVEGPVAQAPPAMSAAASASPPAAASDVTAAAQLVLYIEDNEVNQLLMEGMLARRPGVHLRVTGVPEEGVEIALRERPALVLLDIQLPGIDGYEVLRRLRSHPSMRDLPVVAVSANAMPADRERAAAAGFADYVTKPVDLVQLLAVVETQLSR